LSNRILNEEFISMDVEKYLINRLKLQCGIEFTSNVEGMIGDYFSNKDFNEKYKTWMKSTGNNTYVTGTKPAIDVYV
jgi:cullin 1